MREERWGGEEGGGKAKVLQVYTFNDWKIDKLRAWFPCNGCSCSDNYFRRCLASFALRLENKRRSIALGAVRGGKLIYWYL